MVLDKNGQPVDPNAPKGYGMRPGYGLGACGDGGGGAGSSGSQDGGDAFVWKLLRAGSPRLALARAMGVPFVPYVFNIRGTFATTSTTDVPTIRRRLADLSRHAHYRDARSHPESIIDGVSRIRFRR